MRTLVIFGTRPEAVKLAPIIAQLKRHPSVKTKVCVTSQHKEMLSQTLRTFRIRPDFDLGIMRKNQDLFEITSKVLLRIKDVLIQFKPSIVVVQGDTTTAMAASLAAFYLKIPLAHVEAGLRTGNKYAPFPEEANRAMVGVIADYHFAPTEWAMRNLIRQSVDPGTIWVTGNTVIDSLLEISRRQNGENQQRFWDRYFSGTWGLTFDPRKKIILVTGHRRESFGNGFRNICHALKEIARSNREAVIVYPVHMNPNVRKSVDDILGNNASRKLHNILLTEPLEYEAFVYLMKKSYLILTDSGGIQEEAPSLGKPVLVMRDETERPEGVEAGVAEIVGTDKHSIVRGTERLLHDRRSYEKMSKINNPYGDGKAAERIVKVLLGNSSSRRFRIERFK